MWLALSVAWPSLSSSPSPVEPVHRPPQGRSEFPSSGAEHMATLSRLMRRARQAGNSSSGARVRAATWTECDQRCTCEGGHLYRM
eukprot:9279941-Pyramimonas_sp.AAC.1